MANSIFELIVKETKKSQVRKKAQNERAKARLASLFPSLGNVFETTGKSESADELTATDAPPAAPTDTRELSVDQPPDAINGQPADETDNRPLAWLGWLILFGTIFILPRLFDLKLSWFARILEII